jgi:hypothetical protein
MTESNSKTLNWEDKKNKNLRRGFQTVGKGSEQRAYHALCVLDLLLQRFFINDGMLGLELRLCRQFVVHAKEDTQFAIHYMQCHAELLVARAQRVEFGFQVHRHGIVCLNNRTSENERARASTTSAKFKLANLGLLRARPKGKGAAVELPFPAIAASTAASVALLPAANSTASAHAATRVAVHPAVASDAHWHDHRV